MSALGTALGELARGLDGAGRTRARVRLARAFPGSSAAERERLLRLCFRYRGRARVLDRALSRRSAVAFCGALTLESWEHFAAAAALGRGVVALISPLGLEDTARRALELYRSATPASPEERSPGELLDRLSRGETVVTPFTVRGAREPRTGTILLGVEMSVSPLAAELAVAARAPVVVLSARAKESRAVLSAEPPIPVHQSSSTVEEIARAITRTIEARVARHPETFPWMARWEAPGPHAAEPGA